MFDLAELKPRADFTSFCECHGSADQHRIQHWNKQTQTRMRDEGMKRVRASKAIDGEYTRFCLQGWREVSGA